MDLHKTNFVVDFLSERRKPPRVVTFPLDDQGLAAFRKKVGKDDELAVEASQNVYYFYEQVQPYVKQVQIVDAHRFAVVSKSKKKTDRHDAILLARFLKLGWVPTVSIPSEPIRQLRSVFQACDSLVGMATKLKNMGHGALTRNGRTEGRAAFLSEKSRQRLATIEGLAPMDEQILQLTLRHLDVLEREIAEVEATIVRLGKDLPGLPRLLQIPGVSLLSGIGILAEIGDIGWFETAKQLTAYAGLVASVKQSNDRERRGKITKQGRKRLRHLLVQTTLALTRHAKSSPLGTFYLRKKREKGAGKALCAVARKLLTILFVMLKRELDYWYIEDRLYNRKLRMLQAAA